MAFMPRQCLKCDNVWEREAGDWVKTVWKNDFDPFKNAKQLISRAVGQKWSKIENFENFWACGQKVPQLVRPLKMVNLISKFTCRQIIQLSRGHFVRKLKTDSIAENKIKNFFENRQKS